MSHKTSVTNVCYETSDNNHNVCSTAIPLKLIELVRNKLILIILLLKAVPAIAITILRRI